MKTTAFALALSTLLPLTALADPATECGGSSQVEIAACVSDTLARVDASIEVYLGFATSAAAELDDVTGRVVAVPALAAAQDAWLAYRDAHCDYVGATFGGGSGTRIGINSCKIELGLARAKALLAQVR